MGSSDMSFKHARGPGNVVPDALYCYLDLASLTVIIKFARQDSTCIDSHIRRVVGDII